VRLSAAGFRKTYVTRLPEEKYLDSCCVPKFKLHSSWTSTEASLSIGRGILYFLRRNGVVTLVEFTEMGFFLGYIDS
jgi:hypothetical protein